MTNGEYVAAVKLSLECNVVKGSNSALGLGQRVTLDLHWAGSYQAMHTLTATTHPHRPTSLTHTHLKVREHWEHLFCNHSRFAVVLGNLGDRRGMSVTQPPSLPSLPPSLPPLSSLPPSLIFPPSLPRASKWPASLATTHWLLGLLKGVLYGSYLASTVLHIQVETCEVRYRSNLGITHILGHVVVVGYTRNTYSAQSNTTLQAIL